VPGQSRGGQATAGQPPAQVRQQMRTVGDRVQGIPRPARSWRRLSANGASGPRRHDPLGRREQRRIGYVVAVPCDQAIAGSAGTSRADVLAAHAPARAWKRRSCGRGAKGPGSMTGRSPPCQAIRRAPRPVDPVPAGPPQPYAQRQGRARAGRLPVLRPCRNH
jgi:hypothetical protein